MINLQERTTKKTSNTHLIIHCLTLAYPKWTRIAQYIVNTVNDCILTADVHIIHRRGQIIGAITLINTNGTP
jgi:hypothetical protein